MARVGSIGVALEERDGQTIAKVFGAEYQFKGTTSDWRVTIDEFNTTCGNIIVVKQVVHVFKDDVLIYTEDVTRASDPFSAAQAILIRLKSEASGSIKSPP